MKQLRKVIIIFCWLLVWAIVSRIIQNKILLAGPIETLQALGRLVTTSSFWDACIGTILRIAFGYLAGMLFGILLAAFSAGRSWLEEILAPVITLMKAVPVASVVVIFLIWWGSDYLAVAISFFMVLPNFYLNTLEGIRSTDKKLLEMAKVFVMPARNQFFYIYRPALRPFWDSAIKLSVGMSWKAGVAAEVIGMPKWAIGEQLYMSKIYLETDKLFAWTLVIILLSQLFEKLCLKLWAAFQAWEPGCISVEYESGMEMEPLCLEEVWVSFGEQQVLQGISATYEPNNRYVLDSPSGSGKTTLLRVIAGLTKPDAGRVETGGRKVAMLFQEDRLCEEYSALKNVELVAVSRSAAKEQLLQLLEEGDIHKPCKELSGGMKRRVALARAFAAGADILLLDEPYNGLDEENRMRVARYIEENSHNRVMIMASHIQV
ncbi:MAG: ATP-binding cassette domain-containing protein [Lachnospiraceae bacterium]|nr:ATP-binding cassette domain-containing protein [Lachnospiraceae bacterium]